MKSGLLLLLLLADALCPCTTEVLSIEYMATAHANIVVGVIKSVEGEIVGDYEEGQGDQPLRALTSARFRIDEVLKGNLVPGDIDLTFDPSLAYSSCSDLYLSFQPGRQLLLMLGATPSEGPYRPPLIAPAILDVPGDYHAQPLYRYLAQVIGLGRSPIQVSFRGPDQLALHAPLALQMGLENSLDLPLEVQIMGDYPGPGSDRLQNGPVLRLDIAGVRASGRLPAPVILSPHGQATLDLGAYFETADLGIHQVNAILFLPFASDGSLYWESVYWDRWNTPAWRGLYRFTVEEETSVEVGDWGAVKQVGF